MALHNSHVDPIGNQSKLHTLRQTFSISVCCFIVSKLKIYYRRNCVVFNCIITNKTSDSWRKQLYTQKRMQMSFWCDANLVNKQSGSVRCACRETQSKLQHSLNELWWKRVVRMYSNKMSVSSYFRINIAGHFDQICDRNWPIKISS